MPHRLHLVFDLDATLIDTTHERDAPTADLSMSFGDKSHYSVWLRPHAKAVLGALKYTNHLYMFTAATKGYTDRIVKKLGPYGLFEEILYRESLASFPRREHHRVPRHTSFAKDLRSLRAIGDSDAELARAVLIDDKATNQVEDQHIIVVRPFNVTATGGGAWWRDVELLRVAAIITLCNLGGEEVTRRLLSSPPGPRAALETDH